MKNLRPKIAFAHDILMAAISFPLSLFLRMGQDILVFDTGFIIQNAALFAVIAGTMFWSMRLYSGVWRYASMNDLMAITKAVTFAILVFFPLMFLMTRLESIPRSTLFINWLLLTGLLGGPRFLYRIFKDRRVDSALERGTARRVPVLLVGAGDAADLFIRAINHSTSSAYEAVGLVDEKGTRIGRNIHGVRVLGDLTGIPVILERLRREGRRPQRLIVTKENMDSAELRRLVEIADETGVSLARLPRMTDFRTGIEDASQVRPIDIEDVLGRPQTVLDRASIDRKSVV